MMNTGGMDKELGTDSRGSNAVYLEDLSISAQIEVSVEKRRSLRARYYYGIIFLSTNLAAWFIRDYILRVIPKNHFHRVCGIGGRDCTRTMGVLRISLGCFIFFFLMFLTTMRTRKLHEVRSVWHSGWWPAKIVLLIVSMTSPFFFSSEFIHLYGEFARVGAGVFLILQLVSVIQFIAWWNKYWMPEAKRKQCCSLGLIMSTVFYVASVCGVVFLYKLYVRSSSCTLNIFFISWTATLLLVMMLISLHSKVNRGLLSSGIMASYVVFLCWSAIRSEPVGRCSPQKETIGHHDWVTVLSFLMGICAIVMATFSTGIDSESFQFRKDEAQEGDDIPYKYGFFHLVFSLGAMYFAMLLINWNLNSSTRKWSIDVGWASTWVKIINEWLAAAIYLWKLISPVVRQAKVADQGVPDIVATL
uniref:Serine incorporator n=1 Tax=Opuntia streptacantha TaxID=393608 RepID=A0A7C9EQF5_OPUST